MVGNLEGLCGYFDGDQTNDLRMMNGELTNKIADFGNSWLDISDDRGLPTATDITEHPCSGLDTATVICHLTSVFRGKDFLKFWHQEHNSHNQLAIHEKSNSI